MVSTEAQKRASKAAHEKKLRDGYKRQWFYISAEGQAAFAKLLKAHGTQIAAVNRALIDAAAALTAPPVQDTKARPESAIESMQARRGKAPERSKTVSATAPPEKPVKAATKPHKPAADPTKFRGVTASGEELPVRGPVPKGGKR